MNYSHCPTCGARLIDYGGAWWHVTSFAMDQPALSHGCVSLIAMDEAGA